MGAAVISSRQRLISASAARMGLWPADRHARGDLMMKFGIALVMFSPVIFLVVDHSVAWRIGERGHAKGWHWEAFIAAGSALTSGFAFVGLAV